MDIIQAIKDGKGKFEWAEVCSEYNSYKLYIKVFRDAMKFDGVPAMSWDRKPVTNDTRIFDGVRIPATADELQRIAYMLDCMLMTPKVIDLIWLQANLKFNCITAVNGQIVAISHIHSLHEKIEKKIAELGGDDGTKLISCVGKYWCLINDLAYKGKVWGDWAACNYGWFSSAGSGPGISPGTCCWQRPGYRHNKQHYDPSQTIRLMHRTARLVHRDGTEEIVDLHNIAADPGLAPLLHHQGMLKYLAQKGVIDDGFRLIPEAPTPPKPMPTPEPEPIPELEPIPEPVQKPKNILQLILEFFVALAKPFSK